LKCLMEKLDHVNDNKKTYNWEEAVNWFIENSPSKQAVRDCYFDRPVINAVRRYATSEEWKELESFLPVTKGRALDVGAGNGIVSFALASTGWETFALEPDPSDFVGAGAIRAIVSQTKLAIEVVEQWGECMPFQDNFFDLVLARQVVHHAYDLNKMYSEMARVLRPGGTLIAFRDHVAENAEELTQFLANHPLHHLYGGENAFSMSQYRNAIHSSGLKIIRQWNQFDSVINFAPLSRAELCEKLSEIVPVPLVRPLIAKFLAFPLVFPTATKAASKFYRRPGRAVSFLLRK